MINQLETQKSPLSGGDKGVGLQPGMVINLPDSGLAEVISISEGSAHVRSKSNNREWDISPNSEVEIIQKSEARGQKSE